MHVLRSRKERMLLEKHRMSKRDKKQNNPFNALRKTAALGGINNDVVMRDGQADSVVFKDDLNKVFAYYQIEQEKPVLKIVAKEKPVFDSVKSASFEKYMAKAINSADIVLGNVSYTQAEMPAPGAAVHTEFSASMRTIVRQSNKAKRSMAALYTTNQQRVSLS
jgi:hypothetical protein